jgi:16S rRNA (uracil1498-N3)-methyltransferase
MLRVFHPGPWPAQGGELVLPTDESAHLVRVRRARLGEPVELLDGRGGVAAGTLSAADSRAAQVRLTQITRHPAPAPRVLAVGLPKGDTFVEIIRQATELGATTIQPLLTAHCEVHLAGDRAARKLDRWRATALESCKQSGNPWLPEIHAPMGFTDWIKSLPPKTPNILHLVAALTPNAQPISQCLSASVPQPLLIAIGPEGDFSPAEYQLFETSGFTPVRLPGHVLRVETACVVALASLP